jgi:putative ABC transport system substrate-binding protein
MKRRAALLFGVLAPALASRAQARKARIGFLGGASGALAGTRRAVIDPFTQGLRELGYLEGKNVEIEYRWAEGKAERLPGLAAELLALGLDVLLAAGPGPATAAKNATTSVPIVAVGVNDPVDAGLALSMARPGGNITGISSWGVELVAKRLQLLKDLVPGARRVGVLANPHTGAFEDERSAAALAGFGRALGMTIVVAKARDPDEFEAAFALLARERVDGLVVLADSTFYIHRARIAELCMKQRLPSVWGDKGYLEGGGLASYQSDLPAIFRRAAALVDKILKGAKPGEIPFEQATKLELVVNLKGARALGITVPQSLLLAADEVIE